MLRIISGETAKTGQSLQKQIVRISEDVLHSIFSDNSHILFDDRIAFLNHNDLFRILIEISTKNIIAKDSLLRQLYKTEQKRPGSAFLLLSRLCGYNFNIKSIEKFNRYHLEEIIASLGLDNLSELIFDCIATYGHDFTFNIDKTDRATYVRASNALEFEVIQIKEFGEKIELDNPKIVVYDGVIERVSQIDRLINEHIEQKVSLVLITRGYGQEVIGTLLHNFRMNRTKIVPLTTTTDWSAEFTINDLNTCLEQDKLSLSLKDIECVKTLFIQNSKILIDDKRTLQNALQLKKQIIKEKEELKFNDELINVRLKNLISKKIEIFIGNEFGKSKDLIFDRLNYLMRVISFLKLEPVATVELNRKKYFVPFNSIKISSNDYSSFLKMLQISKVIKNVV